MHGTRTLHVTDKRTVRERITAVDMARGRVAVAQRQGHTVVFREDDFKVITQLPLNDFKHEGVSSLCFSHSGDVLLLGSASGLLFRLRVEQAPTHPQPIALDRSCCQGEDLLLSPIKNIVRQASKDTFAVATGRWVLGRDQQVGCRNRSEVSVAIPEDKQKTIVLNVLLCFEALLVPKMRPKLACFRSHGEAWSRF